MAKLFVSYSRKDSVAARKLIEAFKSMGQEVWVDWEAIPPAVDWLEQIFRGIEEADAFIFMISPDSVASEVCKVEVGRAVLNNKRIIPIVLRDVNPKDTLEEIRKLNWTYIRETDNLEEGLAKVKTAIELDLDWLEEHRRLQVRALEWHRRKDPSLLLRGRDLRNARRMMQTYTSKDPIPTELQQKYIDFSYRTERTRNFLFVVTGVTLIILIALTLYAVNQTNIATGAKIEADKQRVTAQVAATEAIGQRKIAEANATRANENEALAKKNEQDAVKARTLAEAAGSAARAQIYQSRPGELYTSTLLGIDSLFRNPASDEAKEILRQDISLLPRPVAKVSQDKKINALAYSPKGEYFATASDDGSVCIWNVKDGQQLYCTPAGGPAINAVAFSPQGTLVIAGDQSGRVQILDVENKKIKYTIYRVRPKSGNVVSVDVVSGDGKSEQELVEEPVRGVSFQPSTDRLVTIAYDDGQFPEIDTATGATPNRLFTGTRPNVFGTSPNGQFLAAGSEDGRDSIWNLSTKDKFPVFTHKGGVLSLAFSPDSSKIATGGNDNTVSMISLGLKQLLFQIPTQSPVRDLVFTPDNKRLVTASDNLIRVWDLLGKEQLRMSQAGTVTQIAVSPNNRWIASMGQDRTARIWDAVTGTELLEIPIEAGGSDLSFSNDNKSLVTSDQSGTTNIWDLSALDSQVQVIPFDGIVDHVQYSPSGQWVAVAANNQLWVLRPKQETGLIPRLVGDPTKEFNANIENLVFSPDSKYLGISTAAGESQYFDLEARSWAQPSLPQPVESIAFSPDGQIFFTTDSKGNIQAWSTVDHKLVDSASQVYPVSSSLASSSNFLALGQKDKIEFLSGENDGGQAEFVALGENTLLALNANGNWLASTDTSGQIHIWKYQDGKYTNVASPAKELAASLAFSPDGMMLAVGTANKVILIDTASGDEIARIPHRGVVNSVSFSQDGKFLSTASSNFLQQWDISKINPVKSGQLIEEACSRLNKDFSSDQLQTFFGDPNYKIPCGG